jgi:sortase A
MNRNRTWVERLLLLVALVCLGTVAYSTLDARIFQAIEARRLERELTRRPVPGLSPGARRAALPPLDVAPGEPVGRIEIPRLGVSVIVSEGLDRKTLRRAVGHVPGTALPGDLGNVGIAGHRDSFFRPLKDVRVGDQVVLTTPRGTFRYVVEATAVVRPDRVDVLDPTAEPTLTLVTCYPFYYVGSAPERFIVQAREVALADPAG